MNAVARGDQRFFPDKPAELERAFEHGPLGERVGHFGEVPLVFDQSDILRAELRVGSAADEDFLKELLIEGVVRQIGAGFLDGGAKEGTLAREGFAFGADERQRGAEKKPRALAVAAGVLGQQHRGGDEEEV